jgi:enamine deaminase RidA (YjgF/YER057c/UK114 family)
VDSTPLFNQGRVIGSWFEDADAKYCILGDIRPRNPAASPGEQTLNVLETIQKALASAGMDFRDIVRTWFYNDRILDWYAEFNRARSAFFRRHDLALMPASTGIGASNPAGAALVVKAIAVMPKTRKVTIRRIDSPLQCDAFAYGSAFSRGVEVADPAARILHISGTASIEPDGETAYVGDAGKQIEKTMEVVDAMLAQNGMDISDTTRAIAYFRHRSIIPIWRRYCRIRELPPIPIILAECDICRDNLLFEIELDAATEV